MLGSAWPPGNFPVIELVLLMHPVASTAGQNLPSADGVMVQAWRCSREKEHSLDATFPYPDIVIHT